MDLLEKVLERCDGQVGRPTIVAVDGIIGAGKSTSAGLIREHFGDRAAMFSTDLFILVTRAEWDDRLRQGGIELDTWYDLAKIRHTLEQARRGERFTVGGLYNLSNGQHDYAMEFDCTRAEVLILEGLFAFHPTFEDLVDVKVFLDAPIEESLERARQRDETVRNIPHEMWLKKIRIYHDRYTPHVGPLRDAADIVHPVEIR